MPRQRGFTLVELLVALFVLSLLAILSWRGIDGMVRAQEAARARSDDIVALQSGLAQWRADLDGIATLGELPVLDWNGRVLRMTRRGTVSPGEGVHVVAWTLRQGRWLRWQSPPLLTRGELQTAWQQADTWSQTPGDALRRRETDVAAAQEWQVFFFRGNAWSNALSSDDRSQAPASPADRAAQTGNRGTTVPDAVRLVLLLPPGGALTGRFSSDWVRPTLTGSRS